MKKKNRDLYIILTSVGSNPHGVKQSMIKDQKGTEIVEFAIISTLLFLLLFGIIDFGILLYDKAVITKASREGARAGIVQRWDNSTDPATYDPLTSDEITTVVNSYVAGRLITFGGSGAVSTSVADVDLVAEYPEDATSGFGTRDQRTVTVTYPYNFLAGFLVGPTINLSSTTVMRME